MSSQSVHPAASPPGARAARSGLLPGQTDRQNFALYAWSVISVGAARCKPAWCPGCALRTLARTDGQTKLCSLCVVCHLSRCSPLQARPVPGLRAPDSSPDRRTDKTLLSVRGLSSQSVQPAASLPGARAARSGL
ncbi:unnamed protein product [Parnassius apollo]|uniref:(apollo) hypothetical protein n=1 Tax=Parnassius apollo TaxID=110799 RepID=A0A8S3WMN0_PARAO|nr:unnamed protein product [Parnassius apollo]